MSEQLYRKCGHAPEPGSTPQELYVFDLKHEVSGCPGFVPVERCEHGNIDPHEHYVNPGRRVAFCPGSPTLNKGEDE